MTNLLAFKSFRTRLLAFLLALMLPVLMGIYLFVETENRDYTTDTINSYLQLGADVFDFSREEHKNTLLTITSTLTRDWGFRNAFGTGDPYTIIDAADNLLMRSLGAADMMLISEMDGTVIIDTSVQGFERLENEWLDLMNAAAASQDGIADAIITIEGIPYQVTVLPLFLPTPVAWIFGGFPLDNDFAENVKQSIVSDVSIIRYDRREGVAAENRESVIASTLSSADQNLLLTQLDLELARSMSQEAARITLGDGDYGTLVRPLYGEQDDALQIVAAIQKSYRENEENLVEFQRRLIQFYVLVLGATLVLVILLANSVTGPILKLATRVRRIERGDYGQEIQVRGQDEIAQLASSVNNMAKGLEEKEKVRDLLGKVVSHEIAEELLSKKIELGGEEKVITVLFADIKGFTSLCETRQPAEVLTLLNRYLSDITRVIEDHNGVVDKFTGDSVMALFGAPISKGVDAINAMQTTLDIQQAMAALNSISELIVDSQGRSSTIEAGIGVHTGLVVAGNLGSDNRLNYTVIGDTVNLAARLEGLTRMYHVDNIVSEISKNEAPDFVYREVDRVRVKGKQAPVGIYELIGRKGEVSEAQLAKIREFQEALTFYRQQQWGAALAILRALQAQLEKQQGESGLPSLYRVYIDRIQRYINNPPDPDWDGIFTFRRK